MYEYPKEIFNIADYDDSQLEKYTKSSLQVFIRCETELCRYGDYFDISRQTKSNR